MVALLRDPGIAAEFQPPDRSVSQRRPRQRPDISCVDNTNRVGLLYRDLLGAALAGLWSVDALIAEIAARRPHLINPSRLLADRPYRVSQIRKWLAGEPAYGGLTSNDIETLANDPPLPFFILFEAMRQPQAEGLCLGPLGSIIVSEVIFGALEQRATFSST